MTEKKSKEKSDSVVDEHITDRYELTKRLGKGAYGIVWKATDRTNQQTVAVKKIFDAFRNQTDAQRTFREIMFLMAFRDHPNVIRLRGLHKATNNKDIYLIFDFMESDLHRVIKRKTVLSDIHHRYIMYQLLRATAFLHSGNVIHRDQKPSNILINSECRIKIADFGLARSLSHEGSGGDDDNPHLLTDYVATRWYRAPEILVAAKRYTKGVDMWSLGCILGEMIKGEPLFPGSCTVNQIERIMTVLPLPTPQEVTNMCSGYGKSLLEVKIGERSSLKELLGVCAYPEVLDLIERLLVFDPSKRVTASEALHHPFVNEFVTGYEATLNADVVPLLSDDIQLTVTEYRNKLYEIIDTARQQQQPQHLSTVPQKLSAHYFVKSQEIQKLIPKKSDVHGNQQKHERSIAQPIGSSKIRYIASDVESKNGVHVEQQTINGEILRKNQHGHKKLSVEELIRRVQRKQPCVVENKKEFLRKNSQKYLCPVGPCKSLYEPNYSETDKGCRNKLSKHCSEVLKGHDQIRRQKVNGINLSKLECVLKHVEQTLGQRGKTASGEVLHRKPVQTPSEIT